VTLADANLGSITNTATASGTPAGPTPSTVTSPPSTATVTVTQSPSLTVVKSASAISFNHAGQTVTYSFLVTNTGNVTLGSLTVNDTLTAPATAANLSAIICPTSSLNPGAATTCTATYTVTQLDVDNGSVGNSATVTGTPPQVPGGPAPTPVTSTPSTATVPAAKAPALTLVKHASTIDVNGDSVIGVGDQISYSFTLTNSGNTTLNSLAVTDPTLGAVTCPSAPLVPGASITCTATVVHTITQADVDAGKVDNTATATGTDPTNTLVTSNASTAEVLLAQSPSIGLAKSGTYAAGTIAWLITVTNTGNVTLVNLVVTDPKAGKVTCASTTLAPGASEVCTTPTYTPSAAETAAGSVTNTATATADGVGPTLVSETANASAVVTVPHGLAYTGSPIGQVLFLALGLLIAGLGMLLLGGRRRRRA
jgi:uncharacterized repeat protein (TIGR01451 family)/LPXTG-motif cell wall-anchored protein